MYQWASHFHVGVSVIDDQHKTLLSLLGELVKAIEYGRDRQLVMKLIEVVENSAYHHFEIEENLLEGHAERDLHALEHYRLLKDLKNIRCSFGRSQQGRQRPDESILESFMAHILSRDVPVFRSLQGEQKEAKHGGRAWKSVVDERRHHRRIPREKLMEGLLLATCHSVTKGTKRSAKVLNISAGGMGLDSRISYHAGELLDIHCRIGKNFMMCEQGRVVYAQGQFHGIEFVAMSQETKSFLQKLYGAIN